MRALFGKLVRRVFTGPQPRRFYGARVSVVGDRSSLSDSIRIESLDDVLETDVECKPGDVHVKLKVAPCTLADVSEALAVGEDRSSFHPPLPHLGGSEGLWEVLATGDGVTSLQPGDRAVPFLSSDAVGTWRSSALLREELLVKVPAGVEPVVAAHATRSVSTAIRILSDFPPDNPVKAGDRVVFTGASSGVAQILLQLAASKCLESVCLVNNEEEAELATALGAWKVFSLKEFKAMRMDNACLVVDGEGGRLGFTAARALRLRGYFVSYADASGDGISLPVAGQIFRDTRCRGFSTSRWASSQSTMECYRLVDESLNRARTLKLLSVRELSLEEASSAMESVRKPGGRPVIFYPKLQ